MSLPAAAMLLGLPAAATAHASIGLGGQAPASHATCDWTPAHSTGASYPGTPLAPNGTGSVPYAGSAAGAGNPGSASPTGIAPGASGSWHLVSQSIAGDIATALGQEHTAEGTGAPCGSTPVYHIGDGHSVTALSSTERGKIVWAAWGSVSFQDVITGNPDRSFGSGSYDRNHGYWNYGQDCKCGVSTNYGGHWHPVSMKGLPRQFITGITVDSFHPAHAYALFHEDGNRFPRGTSQCRCGDGHVFETWNAGRTWTNISGNLPQLVANALVILRDGRLALGTQLGVYTAFESRGAHTCWVHLGSGLPRVEVDSLTVGPDNYVYAASHSHGTWRFKL